LALPRILLADDHAVVRRGIRSLLAEEFPDAEFGEAGTGAEAIDLAER
jgi:two-component system, NarL family, invasion response regulator UvrY